MPISLRSDDITDGRDDLGIVVECLVEIAETEKDYRVWELFLDPLILLLEGVIAVNNIAIRHAGKCTDADGVRLSSLQFRLRKPEPSRRAQRYSQLGEMFQRAKDNNGTGVCSFATKEDTTQITGCFYLAHYITDDVSFVVRLLDDHHRVTYLEQLRQVRFNRVTPPPGNSRFAVP